MRRSAGTEDAGPPWAVRPRCQPRASAATPRSPHAGTGGSARASRWGCDRSRALVHPRNRDAEQLGDLAGGKESPAFRQTVGSSRMKVRCLCGRLQGHGGSCLVSCALPGGGLRAPDRWTAHVLVPTETSSVLSDCAEAGTWYSTLSAPHRGLHGGLHRGPRGASRGPRGGLAGAARRPALAVVAANTALLRGVRAGHLAASFVGARSRTGVPLGCASCPPGEPARAGGISLRSLRRAAARPSAYGVGQAIQGPGEGREQTRRLRRPRC